MKFKPGNLLKNKTSNGLWLVTEVLRISEKGIKRRDNTYVEFKMQLKAVCIQPGKSNLHFPGTSDKWLFQESDGSDKSDGWTVINEV